MKTGKSYYLCQLLGTLAFFTFITWAGISDKMHEVNLSDEVIKFASITITSLLLTHFIIRAYIKKQNSSSHSTLRIYCTAIFFAAFIGMVLFTLKNLAFGDVTKEPLAVGSVFEKFFVCTFVFTLWSLLYLGLTSIRERFRIKQQLKDQQLASLMNQINPHFLFNSLNTIRGMIYEDKERSAELVTKLSTLFRYNLSNDTKAHTSLAAELEVCQHYLAIEDIRLGERLKLDFTIAPDSENAKIPTMGILTLVENAIKHGISNLQQGGTLVVNSYIENNKLLLKVSNPYQKNLVNSGTQVGLKNLQQRIDLIFGYQGELSQSIDDDIFTVNLTLPYEAV